jgi:CheY-like chemotaxis protein
LHARNGKEAIDICTEIVEIKLVLLDLEMPVLNGFQAAKAIREIKPDLPIIAQTIYADTFEMEKAHKNGFNEIYTKPLTDNAIKKLIEKYIFNPQHR